MTRDRENAELPGRIERLRTYTLREVAALLHKSPSHLLRVIHAAANENVRKKRRMSEPLLRCYPVFGWFKVGGTWVISEAELLNQMNRVSLRR